MNTPKWTKARTAVFLTVLANTGNVSAAVKAIKISRAYAYVKRKEDPEFRQQWEEALEASIDELEGALRHRAIEGTTKPVFYSGKEVGAVRSYSDNLGMFMLRHRRREVYGDDKGESKRTDGGEGFDDPKLSARDRLKDCLGEDMGEGEAEDREAPHEED